MNKGQLDRARRIVPQIFEYLYDQIISVEIAPGTVLDRIALQERFGVSQTPVRDALMRLEHLGLVSIFPQRATVVERIDLRAAREAHFLRQSVELEALALTTQQRTEDDLREMSDLLHLLQQATTHRNLKEVFRLDSLFHSTFYRIAGVPALFDLIRAQSVHTDRLRKLHLPFQGKQDEIIDDHLRIVDAVGKKDVKLAKSALRKHLSGTFSHIDDIRKQYPDYLLSES